MARPDTRSLVGLNVADISLALELEPIGESKGEGGGGEGGPPTRDVGQAAQLPPSPPSPS